MVEDVDCGQVRLQADVTLEFGEFRIDALRGGSDDDLLFECQVCHAHCLETC
jgi:hypothetical protein